MREFHGFPCIECGGATSVLDSRVTHAGGLAMIRRRRSCKKARHRFTTYELVANDALADAGAMRILARGVVREELQRLAEMYGPDRAEIQQQMKLLDSVLGSAWPAERTARNAPGKDASR